MRVSYDTTVYRGKRSQTDIREAPWGMVVTSYSIFIGMITRYIDNSSDLPIHAVS